MISRKVASHACGECQLGSNTPFSPEIVEKLKVMLDEGLPHSCHWREKVAGEEVQTALNCFAGTTSPYIQGPYCVTAVGMMMKMADEADASPQLKHNAKYFHEHEKVETYNPDDVKSRLRADEYVEITIDSPFGRGKDEIIISGATK